MEKYTSPPRFVLSRMLSAVVHALRRKADAGREMRDFP